MHPVTIIGGGLAGLTLGLMLRRDQCPVTIHEAGRYPRHRVCGEFIAGPGVEVLKELDLLPLLLRQGGRWASTARFLTRTIASRPLTLSNPALAISRHILDLALADAFQQAGGDLRQASRWQAARAQPGLVDATGHRRRARPGHAQWVGLKMHGRGITAMKTDLEMHWTRQAYIGLCRIHEDRVNVCGLFQRPPGETWSSRDLKERLQGESGSPLRDRFRQVEWEEDTFQAVAGLDLRPHAASRDGVCRLGDAQAMIAPLTGQGMSLAFEMAAVARPWLRRYGMGKAPWTECQAGMARETNRRFLRRWRAGQWLNRLAFLPHATDWLVRGLNHSDRLWNFLCRRVRGG